MERRREKKGEDKGNEMENENISYKLREDIGWSEKKYEKEKQEWIMIKGEYKERKEEINDSQMEYGRIQENANIEEKEKRKRKLYWNLSTKKKIIIRKQRKQEENRQENVINRSNHNNTQEAEKN